MRDKLIVKIFFTTSEQRRIDSEKITCGSGRINREILVPIITEETIVVMSGPPGFIEAANFAVDGLTTNILCLD